MNTLDIATEHRRTAFRPGERLLAAATWSLDETYAAIEARLIWFTEGDGSPSTCKVQTVVFKDPDRQGGRRFEFLLPEEPYSFHGKLISFFWRIDLVALTEEGVEEVEKKGNRNHVPSGSPTFSLPIVVAPEGRPIRLKSLDRDTDAAPADEREIACAACQGPVIVDASFSGCDIVCPHCETTFAAPEFSDHNEPWEAKASVITSLLLPPVGLLLGFIAEFKTRNSVSGKGSNMAHTGFFLGFVLTVALIVWFTPILTRTADAGNAPPPLVVYNHPEGTYIRFGAESESLGLRLVEVHDGATAPDTIDGRECRVNTDTASPIEYMYFAIDPAYTIEVAGRHAVTVDIYLEPEQVVQLDYDSHDPSAPVNGAYKRIIAPARNGPPGWRTIRFEFDNARFRGSQNSGADFRLSHEGPPVRVAKVTWSRIR